MRVADNLGHRFLVAMIALAIAVAVASLIWWLFPTVLDPSGQSAASRTQIDATVVKAVNCPADAQQERVRFTLDGKQREANLMACGHDTNQRLQVVLPDNLDAENPGTATVVERQTALALVPGGYRSVAVLLVTLAGLAGAGYAFVVSRRRPGGAGGGSAAPPRKVPARIDAEAQPET